MLSDGEASLGLPGGEGWRGVGREAKRKGEGVGFGGVGKMEKRGGRQGAVKAGGMRSGEGVAVKERSCEGEAIPGLPLRSAHQLDADAHQQSGPDDAMEPRDVLSNHVAVYTQGGGGRQLLRRRDEEERRSGERTHDAGID